MEVIDGAQRMQTLVQFVDNKLKLNNLDKLSLLKGFLFEDLPEAQQRKFLNKYLKNRKKCAKIIEVEYFKDYDEAK